VSVVNYTTWKNGISGTGLQANELLLTAASLTGGKFVAGWSASVDAGVWGQPLYLNGITIAGKTHNLLFVTTSNDSVYAFDADSGAQIWKKSFLSTGITPVAGTSLGISTQTGILSTPVIDSDKHILYVVAETSENNATYFPHRLHALDITTGNEMLGGPVLISDPALPPLYKFQRPGLLLVNNTVYVGFGSIEDRDPYHGLLFGFDQTTLVKKGVFNVTATGSEGGIWMSGASPSADSAGNIYISTGNGTVDGTNTSARAS
jgi:outer membrane protein assembly factor BamB